MKLNKISMMLAAAALVGCSEDLSERFANQASEDSRLIELDANFALAGVGDEDAATRTHWENVSGVGLVNKFLPTYVDAYSSQTMLSEMVKNASGDTYEKVGLCWLGQTLGTDVYTNYEFYHYGWLINQAKDAEIECTKVVNGAMYDEIPMKSTCSAAAGDEAQPADFDLSTVGKALKDGNDNLNYNSGIYKTDNKSIFGGKYIVYYPFNENFKEAGTIPAVAPVNIEGATTIDAPALGKATFRYSDVATIEGGAKAAGFKMQSLSTVVQLRVAYAVGETGLSGRHYDQVVLYSESKGLLAQANLRADKIVAGGTGTELYAETIGTKTVVVNCNHGIGYEIKPTNGTVNSVYITALPTTVSDLHVYVHNVTDGTWADIEVGEKEFRPSAAAFIKLDLKATDFKTNYIAVDEASLSAALDEARVVAVDAARAQTIKVIGDIELSTAAYSPAAEPTQINDGNDKFITIEGDAITVPENVTLTLNTNMQSDIKVKGKTCCTGTKGGALVVEGGLISNVIMKETEANASTDALYDQYNPTLTYKTNPATVAAGKKVDVQAGNVSVEAGVKYYGDFEVAAGAKVKVDANGALDFYGSKVDNYGTIEVMKDGKYSVLDASGATDFNAGSNMTNHPGAKFIHNIDAVVGGATQFMTQDGEYRCRVDKQSKLNDAYALWTACSVIEMVQTINNTTYDLKNAIKHNDKYVDIELNAKPNSLLTQFVDEADGKNIEIGNLTVKSKLQVIYDASTSSKPKRTLTVHGDMDVQANTDLQHSTAVVVDENLKVSATLYYRATNNKLQVKKDFTVDGGEFEDSDNAINITCANFWLKNNATAKFGNRPAGTTNMAVNGTLSNPNGCMFTIKPAGIGEVGYITCKRLVEGGTFFNQAKPAVVR